MVYCMCRLVNQIINDRILRNPTPNSKQVWGYPHKSGQNMTFVTIFPLLTINFLFWTYQSLKNWFGWVVGGGVHGDRFWHMDLKKASSRHLNYIIISGVDIDYYVIHSASTHFTFSTFSLNRVALLTLLAGVLVAVWVYRGKTIRA